MAVWEKATHYKNFQMMWKIIKIAWGITCLFFIIIDSVDFYQALHFPHLYPFGAEAVSDLWWYRTQKIYLWYSAFWIFWHTIGLAFCLLQHKFRNLKYGIVVNILVWLLQILYFRLSLFF